MTIQEIIELYKQYLQIHEKSERTVKDYSAYVLDLIEYCKKEFDQIKTYDIQKYVAYKLKNGRNAAGINPAISAFNNFFGYCNESEIYSNSIHVKRLPDKGAQQRKDDRAQLPSENVDDFIYQLEDYFTNHMCFNNAKKWVVLYLLLVGMLRKFEAANILESEVEQLLSGEYRIPIMGKGGYFASILLPASFKEPLDAWLKYKHDWKLDCKYLICTNENKQIYPTYCNDVVDWMTEHAGYDFHISPHRLRQAGGNYLKYRGASPEDMRQGLRHKRIETTMRSYYRPEEDLERQKSTTALWSR